MRWYRLGLAAYLYCFAVVLWHTVSVLHKDYTQTAAYHAATWNVSNYFVSYSDGFVRRGLPGAAFSLFATPNKSSAFTMFWVLTGCPTLEFWPLPSSSPGRLPKSATCFRMADRL